MALRINDAEIQRLARDLADATGESLRAAVTAALRERLVRMTGRVDPDRLPLEIRRIQERVARLSVLDQRTAEEIVGYDDQGLPT